MTYRALLRALNRPIEATDKDLQEALDKLIKKDKVYRELLKTLGQPIVERIQTNIGWVEACDRDRLTSDEIA